MLANAVSINRSSLNSRLSPFVSASLMLTSLAPFHPLFSLCNSSMGPILSSTTMEMIMEVAITEEAMTLAVVMTSVVVISKFVFVLIKQEAKTVNVLVQQKLNNHT